MNNNIPFEAIGDLWLTWVYCVVASYILCAILFSVMSPSKKSRHGESKLITFFYQIALFLRFASTLLLFIAVFIQIFRVIRPYFDL